MHYRFALAGNPNSGKTTMFNEITGSTQYVGNWPGVTIEKKEGKARKFKEDIKVIDLPRICSLYPYSMESEKQGTSNLVIIFQGGRLSGLN